MKTYNIPWTHMTEEEKWRKRLDKEIWREVLNMKSIDYYSLSCVSKKEEEKERVVFSLYANLYYVGHHRHLITLDIEGSEVKSLKRLIEEGNTFSLRDYFYKKVEGGIKAYCRNLEEELTSKILEVISKCELWYSVQGQNYEMSPELSNLFRDLDIYEESLDSIHDYNIYDENCDLSLLTFVL